MANKGKKKKGKKRRTEKKIEEDDSVEEKEKKKKDKSKKKEDESGKKKIKSEEELSEDAEEIDSLIKAVEKEIDYVLAIHISDSLRQIFALILLVCYFLSANFGVIFMLLSWYVRNSLEKQITFLKDVYQPQAVPVILLMSGGIMVIASFIGIKAAIGGRNIEDAVEVKSVVNFFHINWVSSAIALGFVCIAAFICFLEIRTLTAALGTGLKAGMEKYVSDAEVKTELDLLQINFRCCGIESYKDWYEISWVDKKYLVSNNPVVQKLTKKGHYFGKDVPFSCCKWGMFRPCVDTRIEDSQYHSNYKYPGDLTLHTVGCQEALANFLGHKIFAGVGIFVLISFFLLAVLTTLARYMHTSLGQMAIGRKPIGWLIPYSKTAKTSKTSKPAKNEEIEDSD